MFLGYYRPPVCLIMHLTKTLQDMAPTSYSNEVYTTFSFLGFVMCMIPFQWHLKCQGFPSSYHKKTHFWPAWNVGTCLYMFWTGIGCLMYCINSIVWHGNAFNPAPIWCDICVKFFIGASVGIPASSLCINRRLYLLQLKSGETAAITMSDRMRALAIDVGISAGLPIIIIILQYIPQGHLFDILEDIGCYPSIYNTWVAVVILGVPPVLVGLISATYAIRAIISINKRRNEFNELLSRHLNVTSGLYFRLMWLAGIEALLTVPIAGFFLIYNAMNVNPWISWENTHFDFDRVDQYPAILWRNSPGANVIEFSRWLYIVCAILFFSFFGFAEEARFHYGLAIKFFLKLIGIRIGHQTETLSFKPGPLDRLEFAAKRSQPDSFSTISTVSSSPDGIHSEKEGERFSPSQESALYQTNIDPTATPLPLFSSPGIALQAVIDRIAQHHIPDLSKSAHHSSVVGQEHERRRSRSISGIIARNLRSFLDLSHDDSSPTNVSVSSSFRADISSIEEGRPS